MNLSHVLVSGSALTSIEIPVSFKRKELGEELGRNMKLWPQEHLRGDGINSCGQKQGAVARHS